MMRRIPAILVLLGILLSVVSAQTPPRPVPRPRPNAGPRPVRNNPSPHPKPPTPSRRILDRRRGRDSSGSKSGSGTPPAPVPSGGKKKGKGALLPSRDAIKIAEKRLRIRGALMRGARTEIWSGEATIPTGTRGKFTSKIKVEIRRSRDGSLAQRFTFQRRGDLPDATRLVRRDAKGGQEWWVFRPEERRALKTDSASALAESAIRFQDMTEMDLIALRAKFVAKKTLAKKVVMIYTVNALATAAEPTVKVYVRSDNNLISRLEFLDSGGHIRRQVLFSQPRSFGVQKRWTKIVVHDVAAGRSATVIFKEIKINPDISDLRFLADHLGS